MGLREQRKINQMAMEPIFVVCDKCNRLSPSGVSADPDDMASRSVSFRDNESNCQHCGKTILWSKAETWPLSVAREKFPNFDFKSD